MRSVLSLNSSSTYHVPYLHRFFFFFSCDMMYVTKIAEEIIFLVDFTVDEGKEWLNPAREKN